MTWSWQDYYEGMAEESAVSIYEAHLERLEMEAEAADYEWYEVGW